MLDRYFDHAATSPLDPGVLRAMLPWLGERCGNAHSLHAWGREARAAVERAREQVAEAVGAESPEQIVFLSGATEACATALRQGPPGWISPYEHSAVREPALRLGYRVMTAGGNQPPAAGEATAGVAAHLSLSNETGTIFDPRSVAPEPQPLLVDATQALGKLPAPAVGADWAAFSAHKIGGPKGVGALYCRYPLAEPLIVGGGQEAGQRGGTLNVAGIVGFGEACRIAEQERESLWRKCGDLRAAVLAELDAVPDVRVNGGDRVAPHILSLSFLGLEGEAVVIELDALGFAVSSGPACSSGSNEPSPVLLAMGLPEEWARGTVRVSFGPTNTIEAARDLGRAIAKTVERLRGLKRV
ncbi:MAG: cysteine desulfurase [Fimbriimonadales bacterium]|nr:cysteine desulfurase [Fimbriimonadales bacterium]